MAAVRSATPGPIGGDGVARQVRGTWAEIDLDALAHNFGLVQARVGPRVRILGVVKADAYGHGALAAAEVLLAAGAWGLGVSLVEEALQLRGAGIQAPIVVLGGLPAGASDLFVQHHLRPVVWSVDQLECLQAAVRHSAAPALPIHLKIDTGMSRLGLLPRDLPPLLPWLVRDGGRTLALEGLMTHLACADEGDRDVTSAVQLTAFRQCLATLSAHGLVPPIRHTCNSAGMVRLPEAHYDMVRPGIALYGYGADRAVALPGLRPVMALRSQVQGLRDLPAGAAVSYGGRVRLSRPSRLAILPVGYADGYTRILSGRAQVLVRGQRCPVLGTITMDLCMADVTDVPGVGPGEEVTLLGAQAGAKIDAQDLADWAGTIPYEITCSISKRVPRRIIGAPP